MGAMLRSAYCVSVGAKIALLRIPNSVAICAKDYLILNSHTQYAIRTTQYKILYFTLSNPSWQIVSSSIATSFPSALAAGPVILLGQPFWKFQRATSSLAWL